jgi:hypothetical protein
MSRKMGVESTIEAVEQTIGGWPGTVLGRMVVTTEQLPEYGLRKPRKSDTAQTHWAIWYIAIGQHGHPQPPKYYFGFKMIDAAKSALEAVRQSS